MRTLYDSETYAVVHMIAATSDSGSTVEEVPEALSGASRHPGKSARPTLARHGFEIVDKRAGKEVYLDGSWAELFQQQITAWQNDTPTQEEVEDTLERYAELAQNPVIVH